MELTTLLEKTPTQTFFSNFPEIFQNSDGVN